MKKLAVFAIIVLIFGTVSPSLVNGVYGQNDPSILLRIAVQADKQIVNQLDRVYGDQIPTNLQILYDKGHGSVYSLDQSLPDDIEKAKQDFLLAMNSFMQISRIISQSSEKVVVVTASNTSRNSDSEIDRLEKYVKTLETISKKYNTDTESDFIKIHDLIQKLRIQINNGYGEYDDVINQIKIILDSIKNDIRESALEQRSDFIKRFLDRLLTQVDRQLTKAQDHGVDQTQIDKGHELILEIRELLSKNQIKDAQVIFVELKGLMENIGYSIRIT